MSAQKKNGFSLIELMIAITIIAILSSVGLVVYTKAQKSARISKRAQDLNAIKTAIETFKSSTGYYPSVTAAGTFVCLNALTNNNSLTPSYMPVIPDDPSSASNYCYRYTSDGEGSSPLGTAYKVKTHESLPTSEMGPAEYKTQPFLIDPKRDGGSETDCTVTTTGTGQTAWAVHSGSTTACNY